MRTKLLLTLVVTAIHSGFAQKATPLGSMVALPTTDPNISTEACWTDPNVLGVLLRVHWREIEGRNGGYNWTYFATGLQLAKTNQKWVVLSVDGSFPPQWLWADGVPQWKSTTGKTAPYPWNSTLQADWSAMITEMGSRFDGHPLVHAISIWCGGTAIECFFAQNQADATALDQIAGGGPGSGAAFWENAAKTLITDFLNAFPKTRVYLATGVCYPDNDVTMTDLANWFLGQAPNARGMQSDSLSAHYPSGGIFPHTTLGVSHLGSPIMYQDLVPIGNPRLKGATLAEVISHGEKENAKAIQVYPTDPATDETALADFNAFIGAN
jgi:hypothetical protein